MPWLPTSPTKPVAVEVEVVAVAVAVVVLEMRNVKETNPPVEQMAEDM